MNFQTMSKQRKFVLIAAAVGLISCFLPWFSFSISFFGMKSGGDSINGMNSWGMLSFFSFIAAGIISLIGDQTKPMGQTNWFIALAGGGLAILGIVIFWAKASNPFLSLEFGLFIALAAAAGTLISAYIFRAPGNSIQSGFNSLKNDIEAKTKSSNTPNT